MQNMIGRSNWNSKKTWWIAGISWTILLSIFFVNKIIFFQATAQEENMPQNIWDLLQDFWLLSPSKTISEPTIKNIDQIIPWILPETNQRQVPTINKISPSKTNTPWEKNNFLPQPEENQWINTPEIKNSITEKTINPKEIEKEENNYQNTNQEEQVWISQSIANFFNKLSVRKQIKASEIPLPKTTKPIQIKTTRFSTENEFQRNGFVKDWTTFRGKSAISLSESKGKIPVNISLESLQWDIKVFLPKETIIKTKDGKEYDWTIIAPKREKLIEQEPKVKGNIVKTIEAIKVGSETKPLVLEDSNGENLNATVTIQMPKNKVGDVIPLRSSEDGISWKRLWDFQVKNINWSPAVEVLMNHFSWISAWSGVLGEYGYFYYNWPFTTEYYHDCWMDITYCDFFEVGITNYSANYNQSKCRFDRSRGYTFTGKFIAHGSAGICDERDQETRFIYDYTPPSNPSFIAEPATTTGESNSVYENPSTDNGVWNIQYQFCISSTSSQSNCFETKDRSRGWWETFYNLTWWTTYYYFVRAKDGLDNITDWQWPVSSNQIPSPPAAPTCNPTVSTWFCGSVAVSCTASHQIKYTTNGVDPTCDSSNWTNTSFFDTTNLKVAACNSWIISTINSYTYTKEPTPGTINFNPTSQTFCAPIDVTLSLNTFYPTHTIKYTTNGTDPNCSSNQYSVAIPFSTWTSVLKAIACNACNEAWSIGQETYTYNCDVTPPTLSFTDNVSATWVTSDTITADRWDATVAKRTYDADGICPAALSGNYTYRSWASMSQSTQTNNGQYICLLGIDSVGNAATLASANSIRIDNTAPTAPTISCSSYLHNICLAQGWATTCSIATATRGPSPVTVQYNTGGSWISIGTNTWFSFTPPHGTTNVQMRVSDTWWGPTSSNTYTLLIDSVPSDAPVANGWTFFTNTPTLTWSIPAGYGCSSTINNYVYVIYTNASCSSSSVYWAWPTTNSDTIPSWVLNTGSTYYYNVYAIDWVGNASSLSSCTSFSIQEGDVTPPTLSFTDNVSATWVTSDTITANRWDATVAKRTYDADGICPASSGSYTYLSGTSMSQSTQTNNGQYICLFGMDSVGNSATLASANSIRIDNTAPTAPTISCSNYWHNACLPQAWATICGITTATRGPSPATIQYNTGWSRISIGTNTWFSFTPPHGTTNVQMRVSDTWWGPTSSNVYTIMVDTIPSDAPVANGWTFFTNTPTLTWSIPTGYGCSSTINNYVYTVYTNASCSAGGVYWAWPTTNSDTIPSWVLNTGSTYYYNVYAIDWVGNASSLSSCTSFSIQEGDVTPPACSFSNNVAAWPVASDLISLNRDDAIIYGRRYNVSTNCPNIAWSYPNTNSSRTETTETNNGNYICFYCEDSFGNAITGYSINDINIDNTDPTCSITQSACSTSVTATLTASESINQPSGWSGWPIIRTMNVSNGPLSVNITDLVGNTWSCNITITNVDTAWPNTPTLSYPFNWWTTGDTTPVLDWWNVSDIGCAGVNNYIVEVCSDALCNSVIDTASPLSSIWTVTNPLSNWTYYRRIKAEDTLGNESSRSSIRSFIIDTTPPTLSFTDNVSATWVTSDTITANRWDATVAKRTYDADGICPAPLTGNYANLSGVSMSQSTETNNGQYICLLGIDSVGNAATLVSANSIRIDLSAPTWWSFSINNNDPSTDNANVTLNVACGTDGWAWGIEVAYSNSPNPNSWRSACTATKAHTLDWVCGSSKTVYMRFRDALGNTTSSDVSDTIFFDCGDVTPPTLSFTNNVSATWVTSDTITANRWDATVAKRTYDADGICPAPLTGNYANLSGVSMSQSTETNNGQYICLLGIDSVGNAATLVSANSIRIDLSAPTWWSFSINNNDPSTDNANVTLNVACGTDGWAWGIEVAYSNSPNPNSWRSACTATKAHTLDWVCGSSKTVIWDLEML
jgi:hypothetical protein